MAIGAFFPVYTNLVAGIRGIDRKLIEVGRAYGLRTIEMIRHILLPAALPSLSTGLRIGLAQGWLFLVAAELIAASRGLGFLLIDSQNTGRSDIIVLSIVLLALLGKTSDWLLQRLERRLLRWQDAFKGNWVYLSLGASKRQSPKESRKYEKAQRSEWESSVVSQGGTNACQGR